MAAQLSLAVGTKQTERVFSALVDKYRLNHKRRLAQQADQEIAALREQIKIAYESNDTSRANRLKERKRERGPVSAAQRIAKARTDLVGRCEIDLFALDL